VDWVQLAQDMDQWWALVITIMRPMVRSYQKNREILGFSWLAEQLLASQKRLCYSYYTIVTNKIWIGFVALTAVATLINQSFYRQHGHVSTSPGRMCRYFKQSGCELTQSSRKQLNRTISHVWCSATLVQSSRLQNSHRTHSYCFSLYKLSHTHHHNFDPIQYFSI
jgi:hypothetical protein